MPQEDAHRFVVFREGIDAHEPFQVGDPVTTYELAEAWPYANLPPHRGRHVEEDEYHNAVVNFANQQEHWRVYEQLRCICRERRTVAQLLVHLPTRRLWITHKMEHIPQAFRAVLDDRTSGYPLHGAAGEAPHIHGVASCRGCRRRWLVVSFVDRAELILVLNATHGAKVAP